MQEEIELYGFRARAKGTATIIPALSPLAVQLTDGRHLACVGSSPRQGQV